MKIEFINYTSLDLEAHKKVLDLRNKDAIQKQMATKGTICLDRHLQFVDMLRSDTQRLYFAVFLDGLFIGGVSATNLDEKSCDWGVFFDEDTNFVVKSVAVYSFLEYLFSSYEGVKIEAKVKQSNANALSFNKSFGFDVKQKVVIQGGEYIHLDLGYEQFCGNKNVKAVQKRALKYEVEFKE